MRTTILSGLLIPSRMSSAALPLVVWIVEDDARFRTAVQELFDTTPDFSCPRTFGCVETALAALRDPTIPDVLLMDVSLPGMSGIDGIAEVHRMAPALPVLMCTIHDDPDRIFAAVCAGASGYLLKATPPDALVNAVREVCAGGAAMSGPVARRVLTKFSEMARPASDYGLTKRERAILEHLVAGATKEQIAEILTVSFHTVDSHVRSVYTKLHVRTRADAVVKAVRERLV